MGAWCKGVELVEFLHTGDEQHADLCGNCARFGEAVVYQLGELNARIGGIYFELRK